ncbi:tetratricopeptide repeat protein [Chenggangzhangella methanolivorans]|uniref:Tetratricopeptide repeat protein n=1 Tax=Chenggangzhangella methanolivorans TaxID=1437009 RepID=A0A9E6RBL7_9HYPH|nr:tetratricopeptide repeat protein [Chenggangzhangella methanolivorans]QZO01793.1 tetratricopeptide repeat protein [Chenggangzhangella methanolivorans]
MTDITRSIEHPSGSKRLKQARKLRREGRFEDALACLETSLRADPEALDLVAEQAALLLGLGRIDDAGAAVERLAALDPAQERLAELRGALADARNDPVAAEAFFRAEAGRRPDDLNWLKRWVRTLAKASRTEEAAAIVDEALARAPSEPKLLFERVALLRRLGRIDEARTATEAFAAVVRDDDPRLPELRGALAEADGDHAAAETIYAADCAARPDDAGGLRRWARALMRLSREEEALEALGRAQRAAPTKLFPDHVRLLCRLGRASDAQAELDRFAALSGRDRRLPALRAEVLEAAGDPAAAEAILRADAADEPRDAERRRRWARALVRLSRPLEALAAVDEGLRRDPDQIQLSATRVSLLVTLGRLDEARAELDRLEGSGVELPELARMRADLAGASGDLVQIEAATRAAVTADPADASKRVRWARALARLLRTVEALAAVEDGLAATPDAAELVGERALLLAGAGRVDEAAAELQRLAASRPSYEGLAEVRAGVASAAGDLEGAASILAAEVAAAPQSEKRRLRYVRALTRLGRYEQALSTLAAAPDPDTPRLKVTQANLLLTLGRWEEARGRMDGFAEDDARERLGRDLFELNLALMTMDYAGAQEQAESILTAAPANRTAAEGLAWANIGAMRPAAAWAALRKTPREAVDGGAATSGGGRLRSLTGQVVNELRLSGEALGELDARAGEGDEALAAAAAEQVRRDPNAFGPALGLIVACARSGRLGFRAEASDRGGPPKLLHQFWDGAEAPADVERCMAEARAANADRISRRWNDAAARRFLGSLSDWRVIRAYEAAPHVAMRADLFRYAALHEFGGAYLDADDACERPLTSLVPDGAELVLYQERLGSLGNNFIAAAAGHPLVARLLEEATENVLLGAGESIWLATGPGLVTRVIARAIVAEPDLRLPANVHVAPLDAFRRTVRAGAAKSYKSDARNWQKA